MQHLSVRTATAMLNQEMCAQRVPDELGTTADRSPAPSKTGSTVAHLQQ